MQNRYVGDIGDYAKYSLLRALSRGCKLGVSWYLFPDEDSQRPTQQPVPETLL